jgi:hypothetical protein
MEYGHERNTLLDQHDAQIEAEVMADEATDRDTTVRRVGYCRPAESL